MTKSNTAARRDRRQQRIWSSISHLALGSLGFGLLALFVFNYGFQLIRIPPSGVASVPYIELLALVAAPALFSARILKDFARTPIMLPLALWVGWGCFRIAEGFQTYKMWAIRDGLPVLESCFLLVGFAMASHRWLMQWVIRHLPKFYVFIIIYALTYPFKSFLLPFSPTLISTQGNVSPVFFVYINTALCLLVAASFFWHKSTLGEKTNRFIPAIALAIALLFWPSRTLVLELFAVALMMLYGLSGRRKVPKAPIAISAILAILLTLAVTRSDIQIVGRLGSLEAGDYLSLVREMNPFQESAEGTLSSGNSQRLGWWSDIIDQVSVDTQTTLIGLGYGQSLLNDASGGVGNMREPHNSLIAVLGRSGVIGLLLFLGMTAMIGRACYRLLSARADHPQLGPFSVSLVVIIICTLIYGIGETPFVMPCFTVPYYFSAGVIVRMTTPRKRKSTSQPGASLATQRTDSDLGLLS